MLPLATQKEARVAVSKNVAKEAVKAILDEIGPVLEAEIGGVKAAIKMLNHLLQMQDKKLDLLAKQTGMEWGVGWFDLGKGNGMKHISMSDLDKIVAGEGGQYL